MNAPTFDARSPICPICQRSNTVQSHKLLTGLLTCKHCQERLVVSSSGHYVRDPFHLRHLSVERMLRRESHPFYRILRDLRITRLNVLLALLAGTLLVGGLSTISSKLVPTSDSSAQSQID